MADKLVCPFSEYVFGLSIERRGREERRKSLRIYFRDDLDRSPGRNLQFIHVSKADLGSLKE